MRNLYDRAKATSVIANVTRCIFARVPFGNSIPGGYTEHISVYRAIRLNVRGSLASATLGAEKAAQVKAAAKSSVGIRLGEEAASFQIKTMVSQIEFLNQTIAKVEKEVASLLEKVEPNITTIPGVSTTTGAQIAAEIGDVRRFKNAASIVKYAGLNSGVDESGKFSVSSVE